MRILAIILCFFFSILACKKQSKYPSANVQVIDTAALVANSIRLKSELDTLIEQNNYRESIACGETVSHEVIRDSSDKKLKSTIYIYQKNSLSEARIISYFSEDRVVFSKFQYRSDLREAPSYEQNIYIDGQTKIKEQIIGKKKDLPMIIKEKIETLSNREEIKTLSNNGYNSAD